MRWGISKCRQEFSQFSSPRLVVDVHLTKKKREIIQRLKLAHLQIHTVTDPDFFFNFFSKISFVKNFSGLPWWSSGKESALQCRGRGFDPWSGN